MQLTRRVLRSGFGFVRFTDFKEYLQLRKIIRDPWTFVQLRKHNTYPFDRLFEIRFLDGYSVFIRPATADLNLFRRIFLRDEYRLTSLTKTPLECIIDIGGHIGLFTVRIAPFAKRVLTFEPVIENYALLRKNLQSDYFSHVQTFQAAVADKNCELKIYCSERDYSTGGNSAFPKDYNGSRNFERVKGVSLAQVFADHNIESCDLLKLDCEGSEYPILYNVNIDILRKIKRIHMEYHGRENINPRWNGDHLRVYLESKGFLVDLVPSAKPPGRGHMFCWRHSY